MQWLIDLFPSPEIGLRSTSDDESSYDDDRQFSRGDKKLLVSQQQQKPKQKQKQNHESLTKSQLLLQQHPTHMTLENDDYFRGCRYQGHQQSIALCYDRFVQYSPLQRYAKHDKRFLAKPHLCGLEYLMAPSVEHDDMPVDFPCIYLATVQEARLVTDDTYLVNRQLDYMYHYIIEMAFMGNRRDWRIPDAMHRQRQLHRTYRMKMYASCPLQHSDHEQCLTCPHESLIYTKKTSQFYRDCMTLLHSNPLLRYDEAGVTTPLSYNLVSFLCGPFDNGENAVIGKKTHRVQDYDQWVIVPVHFIDLWYAMRRVTPTLAMVHTNDCNSSEQTK